MSLLIVGLVLFLGVHSVAIFAPALRAGTIHASARAHGRAVRAVSLVGFVLICYGFGLARQTPVILYSPPSWLRYVAVILMLPVFPLVLAAYLPGRSKRRPNTRCWPP